MAVPELTTKRFVCRSCVASCGLLAHIEDGRVLTVSGDPTDPVSAGYTCAKGRSIPENHYSPQRLSQPIMRGQPTDWTTCLNDIATTIRQIIAEGGPNRVAHYCGMGLFVDSLGWWTLERLFAELGSQQRYTTYTVDMATVLRACELVIGFPLLPHWTPEDPGTTLTVLIGTNPRVSHGHSVMLSNPTQRLRSFRRRGGELWVIDPRLTETARLADRHIAPRPDTDAFLLAWLVREILIDGADDDELGGHCRPEDVETLWSAVEPFSLDRVSSATDVDPRVLEDLLASIRRHRKLAIVPGTGISFASTGLTADWLRLQF
jgi:anaerobic selenocysteine-containing dehydrogenase